MAHCFPMLSSEMSAIIIFLHLEQIRKLKQRGPAQYTGGEEIALLSPDTQILRNYTMTKTSLNFHPTINGMKTSSNVTGARIIERRPRHTIHFIYSVAFLKNLNKIKICNLYFSELASFH